jgi:hypothetical protein
MGQAYIGFAAAVWPTANPSMQREQTMADISKEQISELVSRVTATVAKEMQGNAGAYSVNDLRTHVGELGRAGDSVAWEISYKTSKAVLVDVGDNLRPGGLVAWEISYKTSKVALDRGTTAG